MLHHEFCSDKYKCPPSSKKQKAILKQENNANTIGSQSVEASVGGDVYNVIALSNTVVLGPIINVQIGNAALNLAANVLIESDISQENSNVREDIPAEETPPN